MTRRVLPAISKLWVSCAIGISCLATPACTVRMPVEAQPWDPIETIEKNELVCEISVSKNMYGKSEPIPVTVSLTNHSNKRLWILLWNTPFVGNDGMACIIVHRAGKQLMPSVRVGFPASMDGSMYTSLNPGESMSTIVDLHGGGYDLSVQGQYVISCWWHVMYATGSTLRVPREVGGAGQHKEVSIYSNTVMIRICDE